MNRKLGRLPRQFDQSVPHMSSVRMMRAVQLPALPPSLNNAAALPVDLGVMLNATLGCCTCSGLYHAIQVWTQNAQGQMWTEPDSCVLEAYKEACHYDPANPATDAGGAEQDVLNWALNTGMPMETQAGPARNKLSAYVEIDPRNPRDVCEAIMECGLVYIGFNVPNLLPEDPGAVWDGRDMGPIEGGHCVILPGFTRTNPDAPTFDVISWGDRYTMTWEFWQKNVDECYGLFSELWIASTGQTPYGLDAAALSSLMQAIRAGS